MDQLTVRGDDPLDLTQFEGHTPGPWESLDDCVRVDRTGSDDHHIEVCSLRDYLSGKHANARLIAAAPRLLSECARLRAEIVGYRKDYSGAIEENARLRERVKELEGDAENVEERLVMALGEDTVERAGTNAQGVAALQARLAADEKRMVELLSLVKRLRDTGYAPRDGKKYLWYAARAEANAALASTAPREEPR